MPLQTAVRRLLVLACLLAGPALAFAFAPGVHEGFPSEKLDIPVQDAKLGKEIRLNTLLVAPRQPGPWQAVVLPSNCTGLRDQFWTRMARPFLERGYAIVLLDSFTPRGFGDVCTDKFRMWQEARVADAVAVLKHLRADTRFDPERIALGGHSNGAVTAFYAAFRDSNALVGADPLGYAAYFGVGTSCEATFKNPSLWGPLLLVSGEKDDYTYPEPCVAETRRLADAGSPARILVVPGANHEMSTTGWIWNPHVQHMPRGIPRMYMRGRDANGKMQLELDDGTRTSSPEMQAKYGGFMLSRSRGGTVGGPWDKLPEVSEAIFQHLEAAGMPGRRTP